MSPKLLQQVIAVTLVMFGNLNLNLREERYND
jgi:hypothetical protein